ncbi:hypothetical protein [Ornithinimicrobium murale]|uniref:hypothetical protein n=1 Tax=Ornithinimicrobium murale TaxID=1050153 RepID=UPI000E0DF182|nr:hypothetical protein [Ornithinimicrobium murale]
MTDQARIPAGHPSGNGGEFAAQPRSEADVVLEELYREDEGTFHYPPVCRTYENLVRFWSTVEVPDESMVRFQNGYGKFRRRRVEAGLAQWDAANPAPSTNHRKYPAWQEARAAAEQQLRQREPTMFAPDVRPLVRLNRMYVYRAGLRPEEREKFLSQVFSLPSSGHRGTVAELMAKYSVREYEGTLIASRVDEHTESLEAIKRLDAGIQAQLRIIREGV